MAKPEDLRPAPVQADDASANLLEGTYIHRVADQGPFIQIGENPTPQPTVTRTPVVPDAAATGQVMPRTGGYSWRDTAPTSTWPTSAGSTWPGPNQVQWNGTRPDYSRGQGGTVYQPRPGFANAEPPVRTTVPQVAPGAIDATRPTMPTDAAGGQQGPIIITDGSNPNVTRPTDGSWPTPADRGTPGGLIDRNKDGKVEDERSERQKGVSMVTGIGLIGGALIGLKKGGIKGACVGALLGLAASYAFK